MADRQDSAGLTFGDVCADERECIAAGAGRSLMGRPGKDDAWGLAFSGGGIRSATFCLGVLQELCAAGVFRYFDYLSTVSGGGFMGGWAVGQIRNRFHGDAAEFERQLADGRLKDSLTHLLRYRNYLLGPEADATAESWKRAVLYAGGLTSNLILLLVAITSVMLMTRVVVDTIGTITPDTSFGMAIWLVVPALFLVGVTLPSSSDNPEFQQAGGEIAWQAAFGIVLVSVGVAMAAARAAATIPRDWLPSFAASAAGYLTLLSCLRLGLVHRRDDGTRRVDVFLGPLFVALPALVGAAIVAVLAHWLGASSLGEPYAFAVLGLGGGTFAMAIALMFHLQMAGEWVPEVLRDRLEDVAPRLILIALSWFVVGYLAMQGPALIRQLASLETLPLVGIVSILVLALAVLVVLLLRGIGRILSLVIACGFVAGVACAASYAGFRITVATDTWWSAAGAGAGGAGIARPSAAIEIAVALVSALVLGLLLMLFDVNQSALLRLYRSALARCFLAYRLDADSALRSDFPLSQPGESWQRPFHIINATANAWSLVSDTVPFTFSALHCGLSGSGNGGSYRRTREVAGGNIAASTALAISGAAVSPNARGFGGLRGAALGIANARLGSWIGNPAHNEAWRRQGPGFGGQYWFRELFGSKRSDAEYLYVTDGGHFENLGIYELVKRRCRVIVAVDAGWDPSLAYEDLANAVRRCATDLSIHIIIDSRALARDRHHRLDTPIRALGHIRYSGVDGPDARDGFLVYLKPSVSEDIPIDVMSYAIRHPDFPYQGTADQFFDEAQFESYRRLGRHLAGSALTDAGVREALSTRWDGQWRVEPQST